VCHARTYTQKCYHDQAILSLSPALCACRVVRR
jgi:hypothetical protein